MLIPAVPTLLLATAGMTLLLSRWVPSSRWYEGIWLAAILGAATLMATGDFQVEANASSLRTWSDDPFAAVGQWLALLFGTLFGAGSFGIRSPRERTAARFGFLSCLISGVMLTGACNDLIALGLAAEIVQFASWALRRIDRIESMVGKLDGEVADSASPEEDNALWSGIATSASLWLGIALMASLTGSTEFDQIRRTLTDAYLPDAGRPVIGAGSKLGLLAIGLIVAGLGSRMGLVPWQIGFIENSRHVSYWTAGCVLLGGQLAGVLGLARLCGTVWVGYRDPLLLLLLVLTALTCAVAGALAGLGLMNGEGRLRRWVASIPMLHGAWLTVGLMAASADLATPEQSLSMAGGQPGALALLLFATGASLVGLSGLFLLLSYLARVDREVEFVDELLGLGRLCPVPSAALLVLLGSLIGQPPLWGFWANWLLLVAGLNVRAAGVRESSAPHAGLILLVVAATTATVITAAVVIRFARVLLLEQPISRTRPMGRRSALILGCGCALIVVTVGLFPARLLKALASVRSRETRSSPANLPGSNRGPATAQSSSDHL